MRIKPVYRAMMLLFAAVFTACAGSTRGTKAPVPFPPAAPANRTGEPAAAMQAAPRASTVHATPQEKPAMTPTEADAAVAPTLSAEEVGRRFLKLIEGLESRSQLDLERVKKAMGLEFSTVPGTTDHFASQGALGSNWSYVVGFIDAPPPINKVIYLDFRNSVDRFADMTAVCANDFEHWHNAFVAMGFYPAEIRGEIGQLESWRYHKHDFAFYVAPQNVVAGQAGRLCFHSIRMQN